MIAHSIRHCLLLFLLCLLAGAPVATFSQHLFLNPQKLSTGHGLPSDMVYKIVKDHRGFVWIGTGNGICRFDGVATQVFLPSDQDSAAVLGAIILDIFPDSATDKVWIATEKSLSAYDYKTGKIKNYPHQPGNEFSPPDYHPYCFFRDKAGTVWISFRDRGLYQYRPGTDDFRRLFWVPVNEQPDDPTGVSFTDIEQDLFNDSAVWLGSRTGVYRYNYLSGEYQRYLFPHPDKKREGYANSVRCIYPHTNGKIYFGVWYEGVFVIDPRQGTVRRFNPGCKPLGYDFDQDVVNSFYPKSKDEFWINSRKGLQLFNARTGCVQQFWKNDEKRQTWYSVDFMDEAQRVWSATRGQGVLVYNPLVQQFPTNWYEDPESELMCLTRKILEDTLRKKIYVLPQSGRGLYVLDQPTGQWTVALPPAGYSKEYGHGFLGFDMTFLEGGKIFIVEDSHFFLYEPGAPRLRYFPIQSEKPNPRLRNVQKDHNGMLWVTGYNWLLQRLDLAKQEIYYFEDELRQVWKGGLGGDHIEEDVKGNIWIRENNGLIIYKRQQNEFVYLPFKGGSKHVLRGMGHLEASPASTDIWIATNANSLAYANADSIEQGILRHYTNEDGLMGNNVFMVKLMGEKLLVFTNKAIQLFDTKTRLFENHFFLDYGLDDYDPACTRLSSGALAVGKRKALALFYPEKLMTNHEIPKPYLVAFKVFDKDWELKNRLGQPDSVFLSYRQNFFSFEFSSINYNMPHGTRYLYQLEGFDEDWQDGTQRRFAAYTNVPGGDYLFKIKAVNSEGLAAAAPFAMYLHISTVWWKTWWFWLLAGVLLLGAGVLAYQYKIGQVRKEERLKTDYERKLADVEMSALRAQMNPHFIFNSLNSIEYYILNNEQEKASDYLNRFSRLIRLILQNSKNTVVPLKDDLEALRLYIELESMRFDNLFDYEVKVEHGLDLERHQIPPMLLQPYVENAIWHGLMQKKDGKGKLDLLLRRENGHLLCVIEDNGIGRDAAQQLKSKTGTSKKSFGMKITGDRLAMLNKISKANASVQVVDLKDKTGKVGGTRVELLIPV